MSGVLDMLVRRRRGSGASAPDEAPQNGQYQSDGAAANGAPPDAPAVAGAPPDAVAVAGAPPDAPAVSALAQPRPEPPLRRGRLRRRVRYLRQLRELQLRDIGGFLLESHRFGRPRPDLLEAKVQDAAETDRQLRALKRTIGSERPIEEVRQPGIGGACPQCGSVHASDDRFCAWCGNRL